MSKINVLDKHTAELIAAGEVVERPSSVIKELIENSIDAGATAITVEIKDGGITYMRVTDNGSGIEKDDIKVAFIRHATSKIRMEDDLLRIGTLGFRGEALPSIASVSHVELITKAENEDTGSRYVLDGGEETEFSDTGCPNGTTFIVRDLFYNVPARLKFLKSSTAEGNAISNVIDKIALSHPEISITYIRDSKQVLKTSGDNKLMSAIYSVYGKEFASTLIPVDYSLNNITVKGYISKPEYARPNRNMQNFFLNGRYVISKTFMAAISEACKGSVMVGKYPSCVLSVTMALENVDVNVHPTKLEIRFANEKPVFETIYHGIKTALMVGDKPRDASFNTASSRSAFNPFETAQKAFREKAENNKVNSVRSFISPGANSTMNDRIEKDPLSIYSKQAVKRENDLDTLVLKKKEEYIQEQKDIREYEKKFSSVDSPEDIPLSRKDGILSTETEDVEISNDKTSDTKNEIDLLIDNDDKKFKYIGEAFNTYLIVEVSNDELIVIDKHAAHERIIFEQLKKEHGNGCEQLLLFPLTITLNKIDYDCVINNLDIFKDAMFDIEDYGNGNIVIRSIPQYLEHEDIESAVEEMAGYLSDHKNEIKTEKMEWIYHNIACRAAIKGGDNNSKYEMEAFAKRVIEDDSIRHCPHGRPVSISIKKREFERNFGRIQ